MLMYLVLTVCPILRCKRMLKKSASCYMSFFSFVTMSAPSTTASQTDFCDAMSRDNVTPEPQSNCDEPIPTNKLIAT